MATTVTLDADIVRAVQQETNERRKATAVRLALNEYLRLRRRRRLADLAGAVDLRYTNDELEAIEDC
jgi:Arc/MetJ family transcription regulator